MIPGMPKAPENIEDSVALLFLGRAWLGIT